MSDRFKFRVWNEKHGRYIQDNEYPIGGDYSLSMTQYGYVEVIGLGDYQEDSDTTHSWGCVKNLREYIGECIIEQCTGLKDKNGKLIYENDIIDTPNGIYRVAVDDFGLWTAIYKGNPLKDVVEWSDIVKNYAFNNENVEIVILGNIHENKELLDEQP